jgi:tetratricopeptide (TPR) repeat protein
MRTRFFLMVGLLFLAIGAAEGQEAPVAAQTNDVWLPGKGWALELEGTGFTTRDNEIEEDGRRYFLAENFKTHIIVSVFLESSKVPVQAGECKSSLEKKAKSNAALASGRLRGIGYRESGELQILEFVLPAYDGVPKNQKNVFACLIKDDVFVDIHVSKMFFKEPDQPLFDELLNSIHFVPRDASEAPVRSGNSMVLFREGSRYFLAHQYREAIAPYQHAVEIEKSAPMLEKNLWRVLVDNLSIAYGITGDLSHSRETLNYGIAKDPDYPNFYYNLACGTAEKGDIPGTEKNLKLAFERRENVIPGEEFPDARVDDSFQKLLQQKEFRQFLNSLYGPTP